MLELLQALVLWEQQNKRHYTWQRIQFFRHHCDRWASSGWIIVSRVCGTLLIIDSWGTEWTPCECIKIHLKVHSPQLKSQPPQTTCFCHSQFAFSASTAFKGLAARIEHIFKEPDRSDSNAVVWAFIFYMESALISPGTSEWSAMAERNRKRYSLHESFK